MKKQTLERVQVKLDQGTPEWLDWRRKGVGSSETGIVLGLSKYMTVQQLWKEKTTCIVERKNDFILQRGHEVEAWVRAKYELKSNGDFSPALFECGYLRASLDGYNADINVAIEIKFVGEKAFDEPINPAHYAQVQQALYVSGAEKMVFIRAREDKDKKYETKEEVILPDLKYFSSIEPSLAAFHKSVINNVCPVDENEINNVDLKKACKSWLTKKKKLTALENEVEALGDSIKSFEKEGTCAGVRISKTITKGRVAYDTIPALSGVDLELYRGPSSSNWKLEALKVKK